MPRNNSQTADANLISAWFHKRDARIVDSNASTLQFYAFMLIMLSTAAAMYLWLGSTVGALAAVVAVLWVAMRPVATRLDSKVVLSLLVIVVSVPIGRFLTFFDLGALNLIIVATTITFIFIGGRAK